MRYDKDKLKNKFARMPFLNKIRLIYSLIILIPILILECFVWFTSSNFVREQQISEVKGMIERNTQDLENEMEQCEKSLLYLSSNVMLGEFLSTDDTEYMKLLELSETVAPLVYNSLLSTQNFARIQIYSPENFGISKDLFKNDAEVSEEEWYIQTASVKKTLWWYDETFFITRSVRDPVTEKNLGVIRVDLKDDMIRQCLDVFSTLPVRIEVEEKGRILFRYQNNDELSDIGYEETASLGDSGIEVHYIIGGQYFSTFLHPRIIGSLIIVAVLLVLVWYLVDRSTKYLLRHLYRVIDGVKAVRDENFEIEVDESSGDEIGELAKSINRMLKKIRMLIDEMYKAELEKKSLELEVLQAKINPHFLYNNLSAINWIAIENGEDRIYEITTQMATFYRTALNRGVNIDCLRVEVENIRAYLSLQIYAHDDSFDVEYDIDENLMDVKIPIFIMQPLVENAIEHGIDTLRMERGKIRISISDEKHYMLIKIWDNGRELYRKIGAAVMPPENFGYGVRNVDKRIRLLCGNSCGVTIYADTSGTISEIKLKRENLLLDTKP